MRALHVLKILNIVSRTKIATWPPTKLTCRGC
jgi:hypothetical protein